MRTSAGADAPYLSATVTLKTSVPASPSKGSYSTQSAPVATMRPFWGACTTLLKPTASPSGSAPCTLSGTRTVLPTIARSTMGFGRGALLPSAVSGLTVSQTVEATRTPAASRTPYVKEY